MLKKQTMSGLNYIFPAQTKKAGAKYIFTPTNLKNTFFPANADTGAGNVRQFHDV